jgi:hypothetical protein
MSGAVGGKTLKLKTLPNPGAAASPQETNAGRAAAFAEETDIRNLRREFEAYKLKHPAGKQAEIDELKLLLGSIRTSASADTDDQIVPNIEAKDTEIARLSTQIAQVPVLQTASEGNGMEIARLTAQIEALQQNATAVPDQEKLNQQHEAEMKVTKQYKQNLQQVILDMEFVLRVITKRTTARNDADMVVFRPIIESGDAFTASKTAVVKHITDFDESIVRLKNEMKVGDENGAYWSVLEQVILDMQEKLSLSSTSESYTDKLVRPVLLTTDNGTLQTNKTRMLAHIQKFEEALHTVHDKMTKLEGDDTRIKKLEDEITGLKQYIAALSKSIVDMNSVIDAILSETEVADAPTLPINRPNLVVGDPLTKSNEMVLKTIEAFEVDMAHVRTAVVARTQNRVCL